MDTRYRQIATTAVLCVAAGFMLLLAQWRPGYFNDDRDLGTLIFLQLLLAALWKFRTTFFAFLMAAFVWAGLDVPTAQVLTSARWPVLAIGALAGYVLFLHDRKRSFHTVHLLGLFCVGAAFVSAIVSTYPRTAMLKAISLLLLFLYTGAGGRLAFLGREQKFFRALLFASELITYGTIIAYFVVHAEIWGSPNSLGLVMGIGIVPLLFWGILTAESRAQQLRRSVAFSLSTALLFYSLSRASIVGGLGAMMIMCMVLRRKKLLIKGALLALAALAVTTLVAPDKLVSFTEESTSNVFYKGHRETGILGSRKSPWQQTVRVISEHPWFGSGFGTSPTGQEENGEGMYSSNTDTNREHGSSYLAILEWVGLLGVVPFAGLLSILLWKVGQALVWLSHSQRAEHALVPILLVVVGGLVHAIFEDWLFAVGYYFTIFFWTFAFVLFDFMPVTKEPELARVYAPSSFDYVSGLQSQVQS